ncbi:MAG: hypothetical protein HY814_04250 [Candidatus Riflebacteria bacterium]|nr:hypothetical protein [Candidatus Riflebacteria bacterium]
MLRRLGLLLCQAGRFKEATVHLQEAVQLGQRGVSTPYRLGFAQASSGLLAEAVESWKTLREGPLARTGWWSREFHALQQHFLVQALSSGRTREVLPLCDELLQSPARPAEVGCAGAEALLRHGCSELSQGHFSAARTAFGKAASLDGDSARHGLLQGIAAFHGGDFADAVRLFRAANSGSHRDPVATAYLALALSRAGASAAADETLEAASNAPGLSRELHSWLLSTRVARSIARQDWSAADRGLSALDAACQSRTPQELERPMARMRLLVLLHERRYSEAATLASGKSRVQSDHAELTYLQAVALFKGGKHDEALERFQMLPPSSSYADARPAAAKIWLHKACEHTRQRNASSAVQALEKARQCDPSNAKIPRLLAAFSGSEPHRAAQAGKLDRAIELWEKERAKSPRELGIRHNLAIAHHRLALEKEEAGSTSAADSHWRTALEAWADVIVNDEFWTKLKATYRSALRKPADSDVDKFRSELVTKLIVPNLDAGMKAFKAEDWRGSVRHDTYIREFLKKIRQWTDTPEIRERLCQTCCNIGVAKVNMGDRSSSKADFEEANRYKPGDERAKRGLDAAEGRATPGEGPGLPPPAVALLAFLKAKNEPGYRAMVQAMGLDPDNPEVFLLFLKLGIVQVR